jgi:RNA polymerase sigma-70 factor (ECF subfamily)
MQQLWLRAERGAASVPAGEIEFWLRAVARNVIRQHWRKRAARPRQVPLAEPALAAELAGRITNEDLPDEYLERREVQDQLVLAVTELTSEEQEIIVAHYFHGESPADLAARLGVSQRTVERRLQRARRSLRRKLQNLDT